MWAPASRPCLPAAPTTYNMILTTTNHVGTAAPFCPVECRSTVLLTAAKIAERCSADSRGLLAPRGSWWLLE
jgi:hypothetical protein